jgi:transcriptional regulator of acetoin/glycerol metabolism
MVIRALLIRAVHADPTIGTRFFERRAGALAEPRITPALMVRLLRHRYAGNVRELDRLLWLAMASTRDDYLDLTKELDAALPLPTSEPNDAVDLAQIGREDIERALTANGGSVSGAARALSLKNRYVLHRLMKKYGLRTTDEGEDR